MKIITGKLLCRLLVCLTAGFALASCSKDRDVHVHPNLLTGEELFNFHCAECHGEDGTGRLVDGTPANILTGKDVEEIVRYITADTGGGRKMPVFAEMPKSEAEKIAEHLIDLKRVYDSEGENQRKNRELLIKP